MSADDVKSNLLAVLAARGIPLSNADIEWAFNSPTTSKEITAWIDEYFSDATLLTKDELDLYKSIPDSTKLELSTASRDVVPLVDRDVREAIAALKSSTSVIEGHSRALEKQRDALMQLRRSDGDGTRNRGISSKYAQEKSSLNFSIEDITFSINEQLKDSSDEASKALTQLRSQSTDRLHADEQVLSALSNLSSKALSSSSTTPSITPSEIEKYLQTLSTLRASQVRTRIDTMLVPVSATSKEQLGDEGSELAAELETLKDEIDSVVAMVISHELRKPILQSLEAVEKGSREGNRAWSRYLLATLEYLIKQLDGASGRVADLKEYVDALLEVGEIVSATENESQTRDSVATQTSLTAGTAGDTRPQLQQAGSSSSVPTTPTSTLPTVLRRLNLTPDTHPSSLSTLSEDAHSKLQAQQTVAEKAFIDALGKSLNPPQQDTLAILGELYAHSRYGNVRLTDEGLEGKIADLGKRIDELAPKVAGGDLR